MVVSHFKRDILSERYKILETIGDGGINVYKALDSALGSGSGDKGPASSICQ